MNVTMTLSRYLARTYFINVLIVLFALMGVIYLFDTVELIRRASKTQVVPLNLILQMGLLKLPEVGQLLFPFAVLFSAMFTFWQLNRRSELIVLRSAGFSVWQFLAPVIGVAIAVGIIQVTVINPIGSLLAEKYERLESQYLESQDSEIALFSEGLWLRQSTDGRVLDNEDEVEKGYVIVHARKVQPQNWSLKNVSVFYFGQNDSFLLRMDAPRASLEDGQWVFEQGIIHRQGTEPIKRESLVLPTTLTVQDIEETFSSPQTISFWSLPGHIETLEQTGFDASRLRVYYHALLSRPLFFVAMVLLAAVVSMRPPRFGGALGLFVSGVMIGFIVFFMSSYLQALGSSQQIPPPLAAWSPSIVCFLLGLTAIINLEDG